MNDLDVILGVKNKDVVDVFNAVRKLPKWHGRWIADADWCELLRRSSALVASITTASFNPADKSHWIAPTPPQKAGLNTWCYFASVPGYSVSYPVDGTPWFSEVKAIRWSPRHLISAEETQVVIPAAAVVSAAVTDDAGRAKRPRPTSPLHQSVSRRLFGQTCWDSTSARKIFG
jgi:hypothetical protein